jgi:hypothetical protein
MREGMNGRFRFAVMLFGVLVSVAIGVVSYNMGVSHGLAMSGPAAAGQSGAPGVAAFGPYGPYGWYRPWGFGFFPFAPFLFIFFWFFLLRGMFWGGFHRRRWHYVGPYDVPPSFDEWHRRAHDRMNGRVPPEPEVR